MALIELTAISKVDEYRLVRVGVFGEPQRGFLDRITARHSSILEKILVL